MTRDSIQEYTEAVRGGGNVTNHVNDNIYLLCLQTMDYNIVD